MDIFLLILGFLFMCLGLLGSFLPVLPGPPISWLGLLMLYLTKAVPMNWWFLILTFIIAIAIFILDYIIPAIGTKKFGGSKAGMIGTSIGLIVGIIAPIPFGIIIGPFVGALVGELINNADGTTALKAAIGSFLGFLTSTFIKFIVAVIYFGLFLIRFWEYRNPLLFS
ncbi:DUF456 domain-containing protein [Leptobacterium sp. I13]|uniref:DUF456 domain-containing protein n=1 Tax=Leptobacterium meishanense TaxID=3128904 RepID=UPI0030EC7E8A